VFAQNKQQYPLAYESQWGGVVSTVTYRTGDPFADFGNTYYNDHHFHYGYHVLAAAFLGYMDSAWRDSNKAWVDTLVRDYANPSAQDSWFPQHRNFDWYHGHSWAHGLFPSLDGKNQESSSEDIMAMYAMRLWGSVTTNTAMIARANLQLAVMTRSLDNYYLLKSDNKNHPSQFIGNKVAGILFENKADHTTFFCPDIECIQGIHMIPIHAPTAYSRSKTFVQQEWDAYFSNGRVDKLDNAWKSIIYANYAIVQPKAAWDYFNRTDFKAAHIDGGASRAWYMAYAAGESPRQMDLRDDVVTDFFWE
jgi:endo-1,3(4)-beta-glucanase